MHNFAILEKLGSGSYSTVYKAKDTRTNQLVALKIMKFPYSKAKRIQDNQLNALKKFRQNPCVIQLKEDFIDNDTMIMVFEIGGINLIDYYRSKGKIGLSESEIKIVAYQIALILEEMHRSNYMHRDLKPENILIDPKTKHIKIVDFGLCKKRQTEINTNYVTTRWYRSPELILNLPYNETIDIYAFGSIIIELYLGYEAFSGKDAIDQLNKIFCVTGTPKSEEWPEGMKNLKEKMILFPNYKRANLKEYIPSVSDSGVNLIWKMVQCNMKQRITAAQLLKHDYFIDMKLENLPEEIQIYIESTRKLAVQKVIKEQIVKNSFQNNNFANSSISTKASACEALGKPISRLDCLKALVNQPKTTKNAHVETYGRQENSDNSKAASHKGVLGDVLPQDFLISPLQKKKLNLTILDTNYNNDQTRKSWLNFLYDMNGNEDELNCDSFCRPFTIPTTRLEKIFPRQKNE